MRAINSVDGDNDFAEYRVRERDGDRHEAFAQWVGGLIWGLFEFVVDGLCFRIELFALDNSSSSIVLCVRVLYKRTHLMCPIGSFNRENTLSRKNRPVCERYPLFSQRCGGETSSLELRGMQRLTDQSNYTAGVSGK